MASHVPQNAPESWRVVVITMLPGGVVYTMVEAVLRRLGHRIVGVLTSPGPTRRRNTSYLEVVAAVPPQVDVIVSNHPARWAAMLAPLRPDLIICGGMPWRLPADLLALPRLGAINMHPARLPRHRGPGAVEWAIRSGDPELGFTIHWMTPDFDTGRVLVQTAIPIDDDDDVHDLLARLLPIVPEALDQALARVARGDPGELQDEAQATYAGLFEEAWRTIDWTQPSRSIHNQVRSWRSVGDGQGAMGDLGGTVVWIRRTRLLPGPLAQEQAVPGTVIYRDAEEIVVQCGDGPIAIVEWHPLSGTPGMTASEGS
jgi:methionyl-tRNA formyltransferase